MLPKTNKGRNALKKLRVYISVPAELKDKKTENIAVKEIKTNFITVKDLAKSHGSKE